MRLVSKELLKYWQQLIDTTIYIYIPEIEVEPDGVGKSSLPASVRPVTLTGVLIEKTEVYLMSGFARYGMNFYEAYTTKQEAEARLEKLNWYRIHYERKDGTSQGTYCVRAKSREDVMKAHPDGVFTSVEVELLPDGKMMLEECPVGLFKWGEILVLKTEYKDGAGRCECYTMDGGERFYGDGNPLNLNQFIVEPVCNERWSDCGVSIM